MVASRQLGDLMVFLHPAPPISLASELNQHADPQQGIAVAPTGKVNPARQSNQEPSHQDRRERFADHLEQQARAASASPPVGAGAAEGGSGGAAASFGFLVQQIAQEAIGQGLSIDPWKQGTHAYGQRMTQALPPARKLNLKL